MAKEQRWIGEAGAVPLMTTTLWDFPSQNYKGGQGGGKQGDPNFAGATPSFVIWNLLQRYTQPKDLVIDPMAGSGTTLDVARDLDRRALGYDLAPGRPDIFRVDARKLPLESEKADFVFLDPPYSAHLTYSGQEECIGELDARQSDDYFRAMDQVLAEIHRILRPGRHVALYACDSFKKDRPFVPIGFRLFDLLARRFAPVDIVAVVRHSRTLKRHHWHTAAAEGNYYLRGFNYLLIGRKEGPARAGERAPAQRAPRPPRQPRSPHGKRGAADARGPGHAAGGAASGGGRPKRRRRTP